MKLRHQKQSAIVEIRPIELKKKFSNGNNMIKKTNFHRYLRIYLIPLERILPKLSIQCPILLKQDGIFHAQLNLSVSQFCSNCLQNITLTFKNFTNKKRGLCKYIQLEKDFFINHPGNKVNFTNNIDSLNKPKIKYKTIENYQNKKNIFFNYLNLKKSITNVTEYGKQFSSHDKFGSSTENSENFITSTQKKIPIYNIDISSLLGQRLLSNINFKAKIYFQFTNLSHNPTPNCLNTFFVYRQRKHLEKKTNVKLNLTPKKFHGHCYLHFNKLKQCYIPVKRIINLINAKNCLSFKLSNYVKLFTCLSLGDILNYEGSNKFLKIFKKDVCYATIRLEGYNQQPELPLVLLDRNDVSCAMSTFSLTKNISNTFKNNICIKDNKNIQKNIFIQNYSLRSKATSPLSLNDISNKKIKLRNVSMKHLTRSNSKVSFKLLKIPKVITFPSKINISNIQDSINYNLVNFEDNLKISKVKLGPTIVLDKKQLITCSNKKFAKVKNHITRGVIYKSNCQ